jgi:hypothetical protein
MQSSATGSPAQSRCTASRPTFRLDRGGRLVTRLPQGKEGGGEQQVPSIRLEDAQVILRQEGESDSTFQKINAALSPQGQQLQLDGTINDPNWGEWSLGGSYDSGSGKGTAWLQTRTPQAVSPAYLTRVPFVPPSVWEEVRLEGQTPARAEFSFDTAAATSFSYRVDLDPTHTRVFVSSINLESTETSGHVTIDNGVVSLRDVRGKAANGELFVNSEMDFRGRESKLHFQAEAKRLDMQKLPPEWGLPKAISGFLTGKANLTLFVEEGRVRTAGSGQAVVEDAKVGEIPAEITLSLHPKGHRYIFSQDVNPQEKKPHSALPLPATAMVLLAAGRQPIEPTNKAKTATPQESVPKVSRAPSGPVSMVLKWIAYLIKPGGAPKEQQTYLTVNLGFTDVDVAQVLKQFEWNIPVSIRGRVTVRVRADIPTDTPNDFKTYRLNGTASSTRLEVEKSAFEEVKTLLDVRNGILNVAEFTGRLLMSEAQNPGTFTASGDMRLAEAYPFRARFNFNGIDIGFVQQLGEASPVPFPLRGLLTASGSAEGTLTSLSLRGEGTGKATSLHLGVVPIDGLDFKLKADGDRVSVQSAKATLLGGELTASDEVPLRDDVAGKVAVDARGVDLGELSKQLPPTVKFRIDGQASGRLTASIAPRKGNAPRRVTAELELSAPKLRLQNILVERITGSASLTGGRLNYQLKGRAFGGDVTIDGQYPPSDRKGTTFPNRSAPPGRRQERHLSQGVTSALAGTLALIQGTAAVLPAPRTDEDKPTLSEWLFNVPRGKGDSAWPGPTGRFRLVGGRLGQMLRAFGVPQTLAPLEADVNIELNYRLDEDFDLTGLGQLRIERVRWGSREILPRLRATARLTERQLRLEGISAPLGRGSARGLLVFDLANPDRSRMVLTLIGIPTATLLAFDPELVDQVSGDVDVSIRTSLGQGTRGTGTVAMARGKLLDIPVTDLCIPLEWNLVRGTGDFHVRDATGTLGQGQLRGEASLTLFPGMPPRLTGQVRFTNLNLQMLTTAAESVSGANQVNGRFDFAAQRFRSANDLTGTLQATLGETRPYQLPILADVLPFMGLRQSNQSTTKRGEVQASLSGGVFRVRRFGLSGSNFELFGEGTVTLAGRLNLSVTATTQALPIDPFLLRLLGITSDVGPLPVTAIVRITEFLQNRVIYAQVTGPVRQPTVRIKPLAILSDEAARYFVQRSLLGLTAAR